MSENNKSEKSSLHPKCNTVNEETEKQPEPIKKIRVSSKGSDDVSIKKVKGPVIRPKRISSSSSDKPKPIDRPSDGLSQ